MVLAEPCKNGSLLQQHVLDQQYRAGDFRIFYANSGPDALLNTDDSNHNKVPDSIENIAIQLAAARYFYSTILGLRFPLKQPIFHNARQVNVYVMALEKGHGSAFDKVANDTMGDGQRTGCGIKIVINRTLDPLQNVTPAHELFHLYQYGYAVFKQKWYLEGMARWMENPFKPSAQNTRYLADPGPCQNNYPLSYQAADFWASYSQNYFPAARFDKKAEHWQYLNGNPVFHNNIFPGGRFLKPFFEQLAIASQQQSAQINTANIYWREQQQRAAQYNDVICAVVQAVKPR
ncbi:peptidase [Shimwellia pseudoproteus]|nr:peptidase [Shimwellia pseudoproteus]